MTKTCIIGVSGYGRVHYNMLLDAQKAGKVEIVGATVINQDEEAEKCAHLRSLGCRIFDDYKVMLKELADDADFCMIPTGTPLHRPMTVAALEAGMNVLVEKPLAGCIEDARAMQEAERKAGKIVAVGYQHMYTEAAMTAKQKILEGAIGKVESIKCLVLWPRDHAYYNRNGWAGERSMNGVAVNDSPFNNAVAHDLMMMLFQAGTEERNAATPVTVKAELFRANAITSADTACIQVETAEGIPVRFYGTHACKENWGPEIHVRGTGGSMVLTHNEVTITPDAGESIELSTGGGNGARGVMMPKVLDAIRGGQSFYCDLETASRQTMVVSAAHQASAIQTVDGETIAKDNGNQATVIPGVEDALREAFQNECSLAETGAPWVVKAMGMGANALVS